MIRRHKIVDPAEYRIGACSKCGKVKPVVKVIEIQTGKTEWRCREHVRYFLDREACRKLLRLNSSKKVRQDHGLLFVFFYRAFGVIRWLTFTFWWLNYLRAYPCSCLRKKSWIWDDREDKKKTTPCWQDLGVLIVLLLTVIVSLFGLYFLGVSSPYSKGIVVLTVWILLDIIIYHVNMLWFDELEMQLEWDKEAKIWSYRRVFFQAIFNFAESIILFGILYRLLGHIQCIQKAIFSSFVTAMTFDCPFDVQDPFVIRILWAVQISLSFFLILIVFATILSARPSRGEVAGE